MPMGTDLIIASLTEPIDVLTNPQSMLWMLPLAMTISVVYKATKLPRISAWGLIRESVLLCGSIIAVMAVAAVILHGFAWFFTE